MLEAKLDTSELKTLMEKLDSAPQTIKAAKRKAFAEAALKLKQLVDDEIGGAGKVRRWQGAYVGSGGGYAAARPKAKTFAEDSRGRITRYQVGAVTNAIDSGHRFPTPSGRSKRYRPRINSGRQNVPGRNFYKSAQAQAPKVAQEAVQQVADSLIKHMEG